MAAGHNDLHRTRGSVGGGTLIIRHTGRPVQQVPAEALHHAQGVLQPAAVASDVADLGLGPVEAGEGGDEEPHGVVPVPGAEGGGGDGGHVADEALERGQSLGLRRRCVLTRGGGDCGGHSILVRSWYGRGDTCIRKDKVKIKTHETDEGSYLPSSCLCWVVLGPDGGETSEVVIGDCENELNVAEGSAVV